MDSEPLTGGNMNSVIRVGSTVRRDCGAWTPTIHRLLADISHLPGVPQPLGYDEAGREMLSFLAGTVPQYPLPDWVWADTVIVDSCRWLAAFHDATAAFDRTDAVWQLRAHEPADVVCHNDFAPYNLVFDSAHRFAGVIDFDTASPGPRVWDLAYLAYRLVPLTDPANHDGLSTSMDERRRRLALLCRSYGHAITAADVVATAIDRVAELAQFTQDRDDPRTAAHVALYRADVGWLTAVAAEFGSG